MTTNLDILAAEVASKIRLSTPPCTAHLREVSYTSTCTVLCKFCGSPNVVKNGVRTGNIRYYLCRSCGRAFGVRFSNPDFVQFARSFGWAGHRIERAQDFFPTLQQALEADVPTLIEVPVDYEENLALARRMQDGARAQ